VIEVQSCFVFEYVLCVFVVVVFDCVECGVCVCV